MVSQNLIPRGGHREEVTFMDVFMIEHILKDKAINLPHIMLRIWKRFMGIRKAFPTDFYLLGFLDTLELLWIIGREIH